MRKLHTYNLSINFGLNIQSTKITDVRLMDSVSRLIALGEDVVGQQLLNQINVSDQHASAAIAIQAKVVQSLAEKR